MTRIHLGRLWAVTTTGLLLCLLLLCLGSAPPASAGDKDCADFKTQKKAQKFFKKHNPKKDPHRLDGDHDGIACEDNPCPCKGKRGSASLKVAGRLYAVRTSA